MLWNKCSHVTIVYLECKRERQGWSSSGVWLMWEMMNEDATEAVTILANENTPKLHIHKTSDKKTPHSFLYTLFFNYHFDFGLGWYYQCCRVFFTLINVKKCREIFASLHMQHGNYCSTKLRAPMGYNELQLIFSTIEYMGVCVCLRVTVKLWPKSKCGYSKSCLFVHSRSSGLWGTV